MNNEAKLQLNYLSKLIELTKDNEKLKKYYIEEYYRIYREALNLKENFLIRCLKCEEIFDSSSKFIFKKITKISKKNQELKAEIECNKCHKITKIPMSLMSNKIS